MNLTRFAFLSFTSSCQLLTPSSNEINQPLTIDQQECWSLFETSHPHDPRVIHCLSSDVWGLDAVPFLRANLQNPSTVNRAAQFLSVADPHGSWVSEALNSGDPLFIRPAEDTKDTFTTTWIYAALRYCQEPSHFPEAQENFEKNKKNYQDLSQIIPADYLDYRVKAAIESCR